MFSKFIRVTEDKLSLVISRSDWLYPLATEDDAGPVDEQRCAVLGGRDGDIVLHFVEGAWQDAADAAAMLSAPQAQEIERLKSALSMNEMAFNNNRFVLEQAEAEIERLRAAADNAADTAVIALRKAWQLGQTYWQQADSEYTSYHAKADVTQQKFKTLCDETSAAMKGETP